MKKDYFSAVQYFIKGAELGDTDAQTELGLCYLYGEGIFKDESLAFDWFFKAANAGHPTAQYFLGTYYESNGQFETASEWLSI